MKEGLTLARNGTQGPFADDELVREVCGQCARSGRTAVLLLDQALASLRDLERQVAGERRREVRSLRQRALGVQRQFESALAFSEWLQEEAERVLASQE